MSGYMRDIKLSFRNLIMDKMIIDGDMFHLRMKGQTCTKYSKRGRS